MEINWKARFKNKAFWIAIIPAVLLLVQQVLIAFGVTWDYTELQNQLTGIVCSLFAVLAILGVVADPTTRGLNDSSRAMGYAEPAPNALDDEAAYIATGKHVRGGADGER